MMITPSGREFLTKKMLTEKKLNHFNQLSSLPTEAVYNLLTNLLAESEGAQRKHPGTFCLFFLHHINICHFNMLIGFKY